MKVISNPLLASIQKMSQILAQAQKKSHDATVSSDQAYWDIQDLKDQLSALSTQITAIPESKPTIGLVPMGEIIHEVFKRIFQYRGPSDSSLFPEVQTHGDYRLTILNNSQLLIQKLP